jgi:hypothetical protein
VVTVAAGAGTGTPRSMPRWGRPEGLLPGRPLVVQRHDLGGIVREQRGYRRVEGATGALPHDTGRERHPAEQPLEGGVASHVDDTQGERDLLPGRLARLTLTVPPSGRWTNRSRTAAGMPSRALNICATSLSAVRWRRCPRTAVGSLRPACRTCTGPALPALASARMTPPTVCSGIPNITGVKCASSAPSAKRLAWTSASAVQPA